MRPLRIGIIGAGQVAETAHIPGYLQCPGVTVAAVADPKPGRARSLADTFGIPEAFEDSAVMLAHCNLDAVSVCTPNRFHHPAVMEALSAGCHVLCEKPPALTAAEAEAMAAAAGEAGRVLAFNFHYRQSAEVQSLKRQIEAGAFGVIYAGKVQALRRRGIPGWGTFTDKSVQGGGPLMDIGIHMLETALYLMDYPEPDYVSAGTHCRIGNRQGIGLMGPWDPERFTVEDSAFGFIRFVGGATLLLETSFALNIGEKSLMNVELYGELAGASVFPPVIYTEAGGQLADIRLPYLEGEDRHSISIQSFIRACRGESAVICGAREGLALQRLIQGLYHSAETGQPVKI